MSDLLKRTRKDSLTFPGIREERPTVLSCLRARTLQTRLRLRWHVCGLYMDVLPLSHNRSLTASERPWSLSLPTCQLLFNSPYNSWFADQGCGGRSNFQRQSRLAIAKSAQQSVCEGAFSGGRPTTTFQVYRLGAVFWWTIPQRDIRQDHRRGLAVRLILQNHTFWRGTWLTRGYSKHIQLPRPNLLRLPRFLTSQSSHRRRRRLPKHLDQRLLTPH